DGGVLVSKAGGGGEFVEDVTPALRAVERRVDDGEACDHARVFEIAQPLPVVVGQLFAGPVDGLGGGGIKAVQVFLGGAVFVVIAFDHRHGHGANDVETFLGIGGVAHHVAEAG